MLQRSDGFTSYSKRSDEPRSGNSTGEPQTQTDRRHQANF